MYFLGFKTRTEKVGPNVGPFCIGCSRTNLYSVLPPNIYTAGAKRIVSRDNLHFQYNYCNITSTLNSHIGYKLHSKYKSAKLGLGQTERKILDQISGLGKVVIRTSDLENELGYDRNQSNLILSRLSRKGWMQRLRAGIYRIVPLGSESVDPVPDDSWAIGMEIFKPCYISGWSAAEHWGLTEQIFNATLILTCHKQRKKDQIIAGLRYNTKHITPGYIFGTKTIWSSNTKVLIADLHRTVIDVLDDPLIGGGGRHTLDIVKAYKEHDEANIETLIEYAEKLNHGSAIKRLGFIGENILNFPTQLLDKLHSKITKGIIKFDPAGPSSGPIITKWGLRRNIPKDDV